MERLIYFFAFCLMFSCEADNPSSEFPFIKINSTQSGITFSNTLSETTESNILEYLYFYNGSGVAVEDLNKDGLPDIYFGSNQNKDELYFNLGDFKFKNVSDLLPSGKLEGWTTGVNMLDINADGWKDIYVSRLSLNGNGSNLLFISESLET